MEGIVAITFTEKAAAELRDRIRQRLEQARHDPTSGITTTAAGIALQQLDSAAVGTLHSFAYALLSEYPLEAGMPPDVQVLDEIGSHMDFEARWRTFIDELLDDISMSRPLLTLEAFGVRHGHLRALAMRMLHRWDELEERLVGCDELEERLACGHMTTDLPMDTSGPQAALERMCMLRSACRDPDDKLLARMNVIDGHRDRLRGADDHLSAIEVVEALSVDCKRFARTGTKQNWGASLAEARESVADVKTACVEMLERTARAALAPLTVRLAHFAVDMAKHRQTVGRVNFHDLLVCARELLRHPEHGVVVRAALRRRYQRLLLDEFQDTDPIQIEMAVLLACPPETAYDDTLPNELSSPETVYGDTLPNELSSPNTNWVDMPCEAGRLFFVGDPKQSIYRFRRADIATYLKTRSFVSGESGGAVETLTTNFRCAEPVIGWVNEVFGRLIKPVDGSQPSYTPLTAWRGAAPVGPGVTVLGADPVQSSADDKLGVAALRRMEAEAVAATISDMLEQRWAVLDEDDRGSGDDAASSGGRSGWRPVRPSDVAVLIPDRSSLPALEEALGSAGIPYRAEASSLVYGTREVRDVLITLQALADPTDELALVAALRSPLYGCGDDDLTHWKLGLGGRFSLNARLPDEAPEDHPVTEALQHLRVLLDAKRWDSPARLMDRLIRDRGVYETAVACRKPRDVWRRLRFLVDQARAWSDARDADLRGGGLRDYLRWARLQGPITPE